MDVTAATLAAMTGTVTEVVVMPGWRILIPLALAVCVGCSSDSNDTGEAGDVPPPPKVGQCRNTPAANVGPDVWVDDSPVIDCSQTHTLQTLEIIDTEETVTADLVEQMTKYCDTAGGSQLTPASRLGESTESSTHWCTGPLRSRPKPASSLGRLRRRGPGHDRRLSTTRAADRHHRERPGSDHLAHYLMCIDEVPHPEGDPQQLTPCEEPHRAEGLYVPMELEAKQYPSAAALSKEGQSDCAELVADREDADQLILVPAWDSEEEWGGSGTLFGQCWIHLKSGPLPAL